VQRVSSLERKKKDIRSRRGGMCGHATKSTAKGVEEEESSACPMIESTGAL